MPRLLALLIYEAIGYRKLHGVTDLFLFMFPRFWDMIWAEEEPARILMGGGWAICGSGVQGARPVVNFSCFSFKFTCSSNYHLITSDFIASSLDIDRHIVTGSHIQRICKAAL
jgi:hypothetical protein